MAKFLTFMEGSFSHVEVELGVFNKRKNKGKGKEERKIMGEERQLLLFSPFNVTIK
jgi:hypothetical protein